MQFNNKEYNPEKHDRWRALTVKQPYANDLVTAAYKDENGVIYGRTSIEVRSKSTTFSSTESLSERISSKTSSTV